jgi:hypothetical protein
MTDPLARAQGRGLARSLLVSFVAPAIVFALFAVAAGISLLFEAGSDARIAAFSLSMLLLMGGAIAFALSFAARRTRALDEAFRAMGIAPTGAMLNIREFHGTLNGRPLDAMFARRGPLLEIHLGTTLHTTLAVGTRTALGAIVRSAVNAQEIPMADPAFANLVVSADDPQWAYAALQNAAFREAVLRAVQDPSGRELRVFALRPGAVKLTRHYFDPDAMPAQIAAMAQHLEAIARIVEQFPPPARQVPLSAMEQRARTAPTRMGGVIVAVMLAVMLVVGLATAAAVLFLVGNNR